jgi:NlpC/P60 family
MAENGIPLSWTTAIAGLNNAFNNAFNNLLGGAGSAVSAGTSNRLEGLQTSYNNLPTTTVTIPQGNDTFSSGVDLDKLQQSLRGLSVSGNNNVVGGNGNDQLRPNGLNPPPSTSSPNGNKVVSKALEWVGKDFRPGEREQCANFVNDVLDSTGIKIASTNKPIDGLPTGESMASRFFGEDIGDIIKDKNQLQVGDLVSWGGTYGGYSKDTITHVGIYVGNGEVVDRSTSAGPVQRRKIESIGDFLAGVRPFAYKSV